ncbi:hypothetical protein HOE37_06430 [Candidatus Woesearchaeota archaeon]|jgi:hypothetical protein|nr:hypothetical protein [Candidatus Woesearchaeota archaeon]
MTNKISRFIIWLCSRFTKSELEQLVLELSDVLKNKNPELKPKDDFKEQHPNYRNFSVDANPPKVVKKKSKR